MQSSDFDFSLPQEFIAQSPAEPRDHSRLMVLHRQQGTWEHRHFYDLPDYLPRDSVLVLNNTQVIPARLQARKPSGGKVEVLLLHRQGDGVWEAMVKGRGIKEGLALEFSPSLVGEVVGQGQGGTRLIRFPQGPPPVGETPLPPYIHTPLADPQRYQTVYAQVPGSVAAPTAGLHFTPQLLGKLKERGVKLAFVTLHLALDSFRPVREDDPRAHPIHGEYGEVDEATAALLFQSREEGRPIIAVGTSSVRLLEQAALNGLKPFKGWVKLFILPGHSFQLVSGMVTNFHLPRSTNLMLVSALAGRELLLRAYAEAIAQRYRFYSFGDCMLVR